MNIFIEFMNLAKTELFYLIIIIIAVICGKKFRDYKDNSKKD